MKIPSFVRINGIDYPVEHVKLLNDGTNIAHGHADFVHNRIQLTLIRRDMSTCASLFGTKSCTS